MMQLSSNPVWGGGMGERRCAPALSWLGGRNGGMASNPFPSPQGKGGMA